MHEMNRREFTRKTMACALAGWPGLAKAWASEGNNQAYAQLMAGFKGEMIVAGKPGYEAARFSWNRRFDRRPKLIAVCADADDVRRVLEYAERKTLPVVVRSGGHSLPGWSTSEGGVVIDLGRMKAVRVDEKARVVTAQAGARVGEVQAMAAAHGLVASLPSHPHIGGGGAVLAGGVGELTAFYGNAARGLAGADCILADGRRVQANEAHLPELLWGLRGAGANFAIATELTLRAFEVPTLYEFSVTCPPEAVAELVHRLQVVAAENGERLQVFLGAFASVGKPCVTFASGSLLGSVGDGTALIAGLTKGIAGAQGMGAMKRYAAPVTNSEARNHYAFTRWVVSVGALRDDQIAGLLSTTQSLPFERFVTLNFSYGLDTHGSLDDGAFASRPPGVDVGIWADAEDAEASLAAQQWTSGLWHLVQGADRGGLPSLLEDEGQARVQATYGKNYARLRQLKSQYDPANVLRANANIVPLVTS